MGVGGGGAPRRRKKVQEKKISKREDEYKRILKVNVQESRNGQRERLKSQI